MKALVVYDSNFGNTKLIAEEVAEHLGNDVRTLSVREFNTKDMVGVDLLVLGSPINAWNATAATMKVLNGFKEHDFDGIKFSTFDTRVKMFIHGDAKDKLAEVIAKKGGELIAEPREFYVTDREGPLFEGEIESAAEWASLIKGKF
ncbi:MAG: flavodoxin family protein [Candidatus Nanopelagicaceae bacterium]|nr:flavodoxin family protein [Candidatus Nanopelagicaceae bacterium]